MIKLVEGAVRQKTPNEIALHVLLVSLTIVFLVVTMSLAPFASLAGATPSPIVLVALLVCLIPTTIGALVPAIGIAGHGPPRPAQRPGHLRAGRRNRRRHHHAAAGQDRNHHLRQPPSRQLLPRQLRRA